jgi:hypothetical protein
VADFNNDALANRDGAEGRTGPSEPPRPTASGAGSEMEAIKANGVNEATGEPVFDPRAIELD